MKQLFLLGLVLLALGVGACGDRKTEGNKQNATAEAPLTTMNVENAPVPSENTTTLHMPNFVPPMMITNFKEEAEPKPKMPKTTAPIKPVDPGMMEKKVLLPKTAPSGL